MVIRRAPRRQTRWVDRILMGFNLAALANVSVDLLAQLPEIQRKGCTVTRLVGRANALTAGTVNSAAHLHMGIVLASTDAIGAGALPDPEDEAEQPGWMWRDFLTVVTDVAGDFGNNSQLTFDLRAQRRLAGADQSLVLVAKNDSTINAFIIDLQVRVLCLMA